MNKLNFVPLKEVMNKMGIDESIKPNIEMLEKRKIIWRKISDFSGLDVDINKVTCSKEGYIEYEGFSKLIAYIKEQNFSNNVDFNNPNNLYYITDIKKIKIYLNEEDIVNIKDTLLYQILFSKSNQYKNFYIDSEGFETSYVNNIDIQCNLSKPKRVLSNETYINSYDSLFYMLDTLTIDGIRIDHTILFKDYILTCLFENIRFIKKDRNFKDVEYFLTVSSISVFWNVKRKG